MLSPMQATFAGADESVLLARTAAPMITTNKKSCRNVCRGACTAIAEAGFVLVVVLVLDIRPKTENDDEDERLN